MRGWYTCFVLCWLLGSLTAVADPFVRTVEQATPNQRVILILNYFDTCQTVVQNQSYAFQMLDAVRTIGQETGDKQLLRYVQYLKDTYPKHRNQSNAANIALFQAVGERAEQDDDPQIAAVCQHFVGQYYFLDQEYGKAFEHLLAANRAFQKIGYEHIPEISRYLYELAFDYYHFREYEPVIKLLTEAARYPAFNENLAVQTYNTLGLVYARLVPGNDRANVRQAERIYRKGQQVAASYGDSLWIGIIAGNLGELYLNRQQWSEALRAYQTDYRLGLKFGGKRYFPHHTTLYIADVWWHLGRLDSCRYYINQAQKLYKRNLTIPDFARSISDEYYRRYYHDVSRNYYLSTKNLPVAYQHADSLVVLTERINKRSRSEQISQVEQRLLIQQHQAQIDAIERKGQFQRLLFGGVGVVMALGSLVFFLLYRASRLRRQQEQAISLEQEKSLRLQKQIVEDELSRAKADLVVFIDNLHEKNALVDAITSELERLSQMQQRSHEQQQIAEAQQNLRSTSLLTNDDWDEFQRRFERVHPHFFIQLRTQFPDITPAEERLLALSRLAINTRQMSRMLGISPESIRKTKYRLRKKWGIDGHSPLSGLFNGMSTGSVSV